MPDCGHGLVEIPGHGREGQDREAPAAAPTAVKSTYR